MCIISISVLIIGPKQDCLMHTVSEDGKAASGILTIVADWPLYYRMSKNIYQYKTFKTFIKIILLLVTTIKRTDLYKIIQKYTA